MQTLEVLLGKDVPEKSGIKLGILELTVGQIVGIDFDFWTFNHRLAEISEHVKALAIR